jgi:predicted outer membrane repeat protein
MRKNIGSKLVLLFAAIVCLGISHAWGATVYVNVSAGVNGDGTSWDTAFTDLQSALEIALSGDEIWVAAGIYKPTDDTDRPATFNLKTGVKIYGGFAGDEASLGERSSDPELTILSGDIGTENVDTDNSYHVVYADGVTDAVLDGFTVTRGRGDSANGNGAGMYTKDSELTVSNCIFSDNKVSVDDSKSYGVSSGGGMYNKNSALIVTNCTFRNNVVGNQSYFRIGRGGGMCNEGYFTTGAEQRSSVITGCTFSNNIASSKTEYPDQPNSGGGGGIYNYNCQPTIEKCSFTGNLAGHGGGMLNNLCYPTISNSIFNDNSCNFVNGRGGAIFSYARATIINCTFYHNGWYLHTNGDTFRPSTSYGGAIYIDRAGGSNITNCIFSENLARDEGGAIAAETKIYIPSYKTTLTNCLFYGNMCWPYGGVETPDHVYTNEGLNSDSVNNLYDMDPLLVDPENGDFHLQEGSPAIDGGITEKYAKQRWLPLPETDFEGDKRVIDGDGSAGKASDIGVDEYIPTLQELRDLIQSLATAGKIDEKLANSLLAYVDNAQAAFDEGNTKNAKKYLESLIKKVKTLDDNETTELILKKAEAVHGTLD